MNIAFFTNTYHPVINGVVRSVETFRKALMASGHTVHLFAQRDKNYVDTEPNIYRYRAFGSPLNPEYPVPIAYSWSKSRLIRKLNLDVIHSHYPAALGKAAVWKSHQLNLPLVFTFHTQYREYSSHYFGLNPTLNDMATELADYFIWEYLSKCHHIIVPSESMKQIVKEVYGVQNQISVVPTGINLAPYKTANGNHLRAQYGWGNEDAVLISVGRLMKEKNWETLITGAAHVMRENRQVKLALVGDGDQREKLVQLAQSLGVSEQVTFVGSISFDKIPAYLKAADIFCFASLTETQGLATMEALAANLPVVAVNAPGTRDVVSDGVEGILTENSALALAKGIKQVIENNSLRQGFQQAAGQRARYFDITYQAQNLLTVYERAIEDQKTGRLVPLATPRPISNPLYAILGSGFIFSLALINNNFKKRKWLTSSKSI